jgi:hypothetical protein
MHLFIIKSIRRLSSSLTDKLALQFDYLPDTASPGFIVAFLFYCTFPA